MIQYAKQLLLQPYFSRGLIIVTNDMTGRSLIGITKADSPTALRFMTFCTDGVENNDRFTKRLIFHGKCSSWNQKKPVLRCSRAWKKFFQQQQKRSNKL